VVLARIAVAVEGLEAVRPRLRGNAARVVAYPDPHASRSRAAHAHLDRSALARVADRIAHHVLDGAVQQLGIARHAGVAGLGDLHGPAAALGLERRILHDIVDHRAENDRLAHDRGDSAPHPAPWSLR